MRAGTRLLGLSILILVIGTVDVAKAGCLTAAAGTPLDISGPDWCVAGSLKSGEEARVHWTNPTVGAFPFSADAIPGLIGVARLLSATGSELWRGAMGEGAPDQPVQFLLASGAYDVVISPGPDGVVYRTHLGEASPLPPILAGPQHDQFEGAVDATDAGAALQWDVAALDPDQIWTVSAQSPAGVSITATLRDQAGNIIANSGGPDPAWTVRLPDLKLGVGSYKLEITGAPAGTPLLVSSVAERRSNHFATEPDGDPTQAHELVAGTPFKGRLTTAGAYSEQDYFVLSVPADAAGRYDVQLSAPSAASLSLSLQDEGGSQHATADGNGRATLRDQALAPGRHFFKVSGSLPPQVEYSLVAEELGSLPAGQEIEPNDQAADGTPVPSSGLIAGQFNGNEVDFISLGITGELRLWNLEASGDGLSHLDLYDGAGNQITSSSVRSGAVLRLDHVLLPPGANTVRLGGEGGTWLLRATALGPVRDGEEYEPDDDASRALPLPVGEPQKGWFERADDLDFYSFHLAAQQRVSINVSGPTAVPVTMTVSWGDWLNRIAQITGIPSDTTSPGLVWDGLLAPGDYLVGLSPAAGRSREAYTVTLTSPSFFDRPLDLEPNDEAWQVAGRPPVGSTITGNFDGNSFDWFPLGTRENSAPLTVRADELNQAADIQLAYGDGNNIQTGDSKFVYAVGETAELAPPPTGVPIYLGVRGGSGNYHFSLGTEAPSSKLALDATLKLDSTRVAAFVGLAQQIEGTLTLRNTSPSGMSLATESWASDERWHLRGLPPRVELAAGATADYRVQLEVPADADDDAPVSVEVALKADDAAVVTAHAAVSLAADDPLVGPHRDEPVITQLRGGLDVAWIALGAQADQPAAGLFDGVVDAAGVSLDLNQPLAVRLAGEEPIPLAGVILKPARGGPPSDRLASFAIEVSVDGVSYNRVLEATLSPATREQAFALTASVPVRAARLVPLSAAGGPNQTRPRLAELEVIADPAFSLGEGFDIADRALGGHVVRAAGVGDVVLTGEATVWPASSPVYLPSDRLEPAEFVLGFLNSRAARVRKIVWHSRTDIPAEERIQQVSVDASPDGALGPWTPLGTLSMGTADEQSIELASPMWIRALRFTVSTTQPGRVAMPDRIGVFEAPGPTILGAWGDLSRSGPFEEQQADNEAAASLFLEVSHDPRTPTKLPLGSTAGGTVHRGLSEDWYEVELPEGARAIRAAVPTRTTSSVTLTLVAQNGTETAFEQDSKDPSVFIASAAPGHWRVRVSQPVASVVVTWDTSMSVGSMTPFIERMIRRLAWNIDPRSETLNLLPFRNETSEFLMPWSADRAAIFGALHAYPFNDTSSDAEDSLLFSAEQLDARVGERAVVIVTDGSYSGVAKNDVLWRRLAEGQVKVFSLYLPVDNDPIRAMAQAGIMHDWADAAGGHISRFASVGDAEIEFRRLRAWLNRPASYEFSLSADTAPPAPGFLDVRLSAPAAPDQPPSSTSPDLAMSVVLDASGSMLQKLGKDRRIDIAKRVLHDLGDKVLPDGLQVSLRVFGHDHPGSCASELFLPLGPLDRSTFSAAVDRVKSVNLARTSIAESLRAAGEDLAGSSGNKIIVLVTDGNETCGGDPLAAVQALRSGGVNVQLNIVGFAIDDPTVRDLLQSWAEAGAGHFFDASDPDGLRKALEEAVTIPFKVKSSEGTEVAQGVVGGQPLSLPPGKYVISIEGHPDREVTIQSGETALIDLAG